MHARVGDQLTIRGHHVGEPERHAEIVEVRGEEGDPPYLVLWDDTGHRTLFFPGTDAVIEHLHSV